jgi:RNA polymerase sigma factor (sigma-70 family)
MHIRRWGVASSGLDPLLNRIARNLLIDRYRRTSPHLVPLDSADEIQDPAQDPTEEVARRQRRSAVHSAIRSLPTRHQKAISYSLSGLTPEEVGKEMGIGRNAADALLHRARRSLREHLAPVKDGMWGVAIGFKVRWSRITRRLGVSDGAGEAIRLTVLQSGLGVAAAAMVTVATIGGGGSGLPPTFSSSRVATNGVASVASHRSGGNSVTGPAGGATSPGETAGDGSVSLGVGDVSNTHWGGGIDNHTGVPSTPGQKDQPEIIGVDVHVGSSDDETPTDRRIQSAEGTFCRAAPLVCWA